MLKGAFTVGGWTLASRVFGFLRDMQIAAFLGAGPVADAFFLALRLPNLFRRLFGEGAFNAAFVPSFTAILHQEGEENAREFAEQAAAVMVFWLAFLTVLGEIIMPWLLTALAPGFRAYPAKFALGVDLGRITFPYLFLICITALVSGVLNAMERYAAAAAAPVLLNIVAIASLYLFRPFVPNAGYALAWGVSLSGVFQLALVVAALRRAGMKLRLPRPRLTPRMRALFRRMAPGLLAAGVMQLNLLIDSLIASLLPPGSYAYLYYADRVNQLPLGVIGAAMGTALLTTLSRQIAGGRDAEAEASLNRASEYTMVLCIPAAIALVILAEPIMAVLFGRGAFTLTDAIKSAQSLAAYAIGLPAFVLVKVFAPGFFARGDTTTPLRTGLAAIALNLGLNIAFMHPLKHVGPALASSIAATFNLALLAWLLHKRGYFTPDARLCRALPRIAGAGAIMAVVLWFASRHLAPHPSFAVFLGVCALGAATYGAAGMALGAFSLAEMKRVFRRRRA